METGLVPVHSSYRRGEKIPMCHVPQRHNTWLITWMIIKRTAWRSRKVRKAIKIERVFLSQGLLTGQGVRVHLERKITGTLVKPICKPMVCHKISTISNKHPMFNTDIHVLNVQNMEPVPKAQVSYLCVLSSCIHETWSTSDKRRLKVLFCYVAGQR